MWTRACWTKKASCLDKANLIVYSHGEYLALGRKLGTFGYSVRKKKPAKRKK